MDVPPAGAVGSHGLETLTSSYQAPDCANILLPARLFFPVLENFHFHSSLSPPTNFYEPEFHLTPSGPEEQIDDGLPPVLTEPREQATTFLAKKSLKFNRANSGGLLHRVMNWKQVSTRVHPQAPTTLCRNSGERKFV